MKIKVLFFAQLREAVGMHEKEIELQDGAHVGEVMEALFQDSSLTQFRGISIGHAVNEDFVSEEKVLKERDVLALIPPVAGG